MTGDKEELSKMVYGYKSDFEIADMARMLMRDDLNHEAVCTASRDRIMYLNQQVSKWQDIALEVATLSGNTEAEDLINLTLSEQREALNSLKNRAQYDSGRKDTPSSIWIIHHVLNDKEDLNLRLFDADRTQVIPIDMFRGDGLYRVMFDKPITGHWTLNTI